MRSTQLIAICVSLAFAIASAQQMPTTIRVHVISHSHDDVGWLKTPNMYYYGLNNSIQHASVKLIYDSVVEALAANPARKFSCVEMYFFSKWYGEQSDSRRQLVRKLVANGQLVFISGGWTMNDEACAHYVDIIDQMTLGHRFIKEEFGIAPSDGWQLDPFGSSAAQVMLFSQRAGFNSTYHSRIDYQDFSHRQLTQTREFAWIPSPSLGANAQVMASSMLHSTYCPQYTMNFDVLLETDSVACRNSADSPDGQCNPLNRESWIERIRSLLVSDYMVTAGNDIMLTMGCDFTYMQARKWFDSLDQLITMLNDRKEGSGGGKFEFEAFYSTPTEYAAAKARALYQSRGTTSTTDTGAAPLPAPPPKTGDFFPYADGPHMFWTGYYTSRPSFKRLVRRTSTYLAALRMLRAALAIQQAARPEGGIVNFASLESAMGVAQHHDAITGTAKQHVSNDYTMHLAAGLSDAVTALEAAHLRHSKSTGIGRISVCPRANISHCESIATQGSPFVVAIVNPRAVSAIAPAFDRFVVMIPVPTDKIVARDSRGTRVPSVVFPAAAMSDFGRHLDAEGAKLPYFAALRVEVPPLASVAIVLEEHETPQPTPTPPSTVLVDGSVVETDALLLRFGADGLLRSVHNKIAGTERSITQFWCYYSSSVGDDDSWQSSGAYIFRPQSSSGAVCLRSASVQVVAVAADVVTIVEQRFEGGWITQRLIIRPGDPIFDIEFDVGPIPLDGSGGAAGTPGKEVVMRFEADIASGADFFTDSNGLEMIKRVRDVRDSFPYVVTEPIASNYYPVTAAIAVADASAQLTVFVDAAVGGASLASGAVELMVHRVVLKDDWRGVGEPLNETEHVEPYTNCEWRQQYRDASGRCGAHHGSHMLVRGQFGVSLDAASSAKSKWRERAEARYRHPVWLVVKPAVGQGSSDSLASRLAQELDASPLWKVHIDTTKLAASRAVEVVTIDAWNSTTLIIRLAHRGECDSRASCSAMLATVRLHDIFPFVNFFSEVTLTANAPLRPDWAVPPWRLDDELERTFGRPAGSFDAASTVLRLFPMEIATFFAVLQ